MADGGKDSIGVESIGEDNLYLADSVGHLSFAIIK